MKICLNCQFAEMTTIDTDRGPQRVLACHFEECRDPITGVPLPLTTARTNDVFCGVKGRYFKLKKEEEKKEESKVIQLK